MKLDFPGEHHLTYCLNVHPGESLSDVKRSILDFASPIGRELAGESPFGIGLRLSHSAARELLQGDALSEFADLLRVQNLYIFTINGFPAGRFSGPGVKESVYLPDWRDPQRLEYSIALGQILASLLPDDVNYGSISTLPGAFKPTIKSEEDRQSIAENLSRCAAAYHRIREETGKRIVLAIEPEPLCLLETVEETCDFFLQDLYSGRGQRVFRDRTGLSPQESDEALRSTLGLCFDTCHSAVEFESPDSALQRIRSAGISIAKYQISSALEISPDSPNGIERIKDFLDPVYLHQVVEKKGNTLVRFTDLDEAIRAFETKESVSPDAKDDSQSTWRIHFHVPLFYEGDESLQTTKNAAKETIQTIIKEEEGSHLEVETYTWDVLPSGMRGERIHEDILRELRWVEEFFI